MAAFRTQHFDHVGTYGKDLKKDDNFLAARGLAPYLLIYAFAGPILSAPTSDGPSFESMLSRYRFLTSESSCKCLSGFRTEGMRGRGPERSVVEADSGIRWLLIQEFDEVDFLDFLDLDLKKKEAKHWWYKNKWEKNSVAFYKLEGLPSNSGFGDDFRDYVDDDDVNEDL